MRTLAFALGFALTTPALADPISDCIAENVTVSATFDEFYWRGAYYSMGLKNDLSIPIGGLVLRYELWAEGRPLPVGSGHWGQFRILDGGLLSGEETEMRVAVVLEKRELELAKNAPSLRLDLFVENAADVELRPLGPRRNPFVGWQNDNPSDQPCAPKAS